MHAHIFVNLYVRLHACFCTYVYVFFLIKEKARRRKSKWKNGYSKDSLISSEDAALLRDVYMDKIADGIFKGNINCYSEVTDGEYCVFRDPRSAMAEWYMLFINQSCTYTYYKHHNLKMSDDQLVRDVPDVLAVMFDGSNALGVHGGKQICVGSIKWTGNEEGFKSSTQSSLIYLLANRSEDDEDTKNVELQELRKLRKMRDLDEYEACDADGRIHIIHFTNTVIKVWIFEHIN